jgi:hypothetical protein
MPRKAFRAGTEAARLLHHEQAKAAGFAKNTHPCPVLAGNWVREHRGIYRLTRFPATDQPDLALWSLWSSNRKEEVECVYSHQTATSLFNLSDLNPASLRTTVPKGFRRNSETRGHYASLPASDAQNGTGYMYTRPLRTPLDLIGSGEVELNFIRQALTQAVDRAMVTRQQIRDAHLSEPPRKTIEEMLHEAA